MHKMAVRAQLNAPAPARRPPRRHLSATHAVRPACAADVADIHALVSEFAAEGLLLPRSQDEIAAALDGYVVAVDATSRVRACAALHEYSPSLAEVGAVAVARDARRRGLGGIVVRGVEALARQRGVVELIAITDAAGFFESLGFARTRLSRYPEKLARYARLQAGGVRIRRKACYRKAVA